MTSKPMERDRGQCCMEVLSRRMERQQRTMEPNTSRPMSTDSSQMQRWSLDSVMVRHKRRPTCRRTRTKLKIYKIHN